MEQIQKQHAPNAQRLGEISSNIVSRLKLKMAEDSNGIATIADGKVLTEKQQAILEKRGIDVDLAVSMGWRKGPKDSIEIPYFRNGIEVNCKTRTIEGEKKFFQRQDGEQCLYNLDALRAETIVITEGEMDCLIALQCGFNAVSVPNGAPATAIGDHATTKYDYLTDVPKSLRDITLAVDSDGPGVNLLNDLALRLGRHRCRWIEYPQGCKDLNDVMLKYGKDEVIRVLTEGRFMKVDGIYKLTDLPPLPEYKAFDVGIYKLADNFRLRQGDFSVFTGIPSHGKTTLANHIAYNMAKNHNWNVCMASFEQPPQTELKKSLSILNGLQNGTDAWIDEHFTFIVPDDESDDWFTLDWLKERMVAAVVRHNAKLIIIDPWNELDHIYDQRETSLTQYTGKAIKELKRFARRYQVHVMVIAHPAKLKKNKDGKYPVPTAYDISDSSHWYNKPDQIVVVHREDDKTLVRVAKSRYHYTLGKPGDVELYFNENSRRYA